MGKLVLLNKGGTEQRIVRASSITIPDCWLIAERLGLKTPDGKAVLETWHLAHDLLRHIKEL